MRIVKYYGNSKTLPRGPCERQLDVSRRRLTPHCLATIFDSQLPSPKLSPKMPPKLSLARKRGHFFLFQNDPRGEGTIGAKIITHTTFIVEEFILQLHTHISCTTLIVEELICVIMCASCVCLSCLYYITESQLHSKNAQGINIQLHAHQLHNNNCWGVNCVIIPAPMVIASGNFSPATSRCLFWPTGVDRFSVP